MIEHLFRHMILSAARDIARTIGDRYPESKAKTRNVLLISGFLLPLPLGVSLWTGAIGGLPFGVIAIFGVFAIVGAAALIFGLAFLQIINEEKEIGRQRSISTVATRTGLQD